MRAIFKDASRRLLPGIIVARYGEARAAYDGQQWAEAARGFQLVVSLASDPDLNASDAKAGRTYKAAGGRVPEAGWASAAEPRLPTRRRPPSFLVLAAGPEKPADAANAAGGAPPHLIALTHP